MFQKIDPEKVLLIVKRIGPCVPNDVRRELGLSDTLVVGATLSELLRSGKLKTTEVRKGSSAFYYDPQNPASLEKASSYLNEKDVRTFNLLKEKKILGDYEVEPLTRVSLRNIKDYSKKLSINYKDQELTFWRYFLISQEEAISLIKSRLGVKKKIGKPVENKQEPKEKIVKETPREEPVVFEEIKEKEIVKEKELIQEKPKVVQQTLVKKEEKETKKETKQTKVKEVIVESEEEKEVEIIDDFYNEIKNYFEKNNISIVEQKLIRKNSELDFVILLPTPLGDVKYYCKAKSKKKSNDGDLASAKMQGLSQNLPTAYLTTGEVTKKAKNMLNNELKGIVVKEL